MLNPTNYALLDLTCYLAPRFNSAEAHNSSRRTCADSDRRPGGSGPRRSRCSGRGCACRAPPRTRPRCGRRGWAWWGWWGIGGGWWWAVGWHRPGPPHCSPHPGSGCSGACNVNYIVLQARCTYTVQYNFVYLACLGWLVSIFNPDSISGLLYQQSGVYYQRATTSIYRK